MICEAQQQLALILKSAFTALIEAGKGCAIGPESALGVVKTGAGKEGEQDRTQAVAELPQRGHGAASPLPPADAKIALLRTDGADKLRQSSGVVLAVAIHGDHPVITLSPGGLEC